MSAFTETEKVRSLWHPITDEDFEIDTSKPFVIFTGEASLILIEGKDDLFDYFGDPKDGLVDANGKISEEGKAELRLDDIAYMYVDDDFYREIEPFRDNNRIEQVKGERERPELFIRYKSGKIRFTDHFVFEMDGSLPVPGVPSFHNYSNEYIDDEPIEYVVNLDWCMAINPQAIFFRPVEPIKDAAVQKKNDCIVGLTEHVRQQLIQHCDQEIESLTISGYVFSIHCQGCRIFKEILHRVPDELIDKGDEPGYSFDGL